MNEHPRHTPQPRQNFVLTLLTTTDNAAADGVATNVVTATLKDGTEWAQGENLLFTVTGDAVFTDSHAQTTTGTISSQGYATADLNDPTAETVTVTAIVLSDTSVSAQTPVTFGSGGLVRPAPELDELVNDRIPVDTATLTLRIPAWGAMAVGDNVAYHWQVTSATDIGDDIHDNRHLTATDIGHDVTFSLPVDLAVEPYDGGSVEAWYTVTPAAGGADEESAHATWPVGEEEPLPAPVVQEAEDGHIDLGDVGEDFHVELAWSGMAENDRVTLYWQGTDADGVAGPETPVANHPVTSHDVTAGQVVLTLKTELLSPYETGSVAAFYTLNRADGSPTAQSETATYQVTPVVQTLFEDFEGNEFQTIKQGQSVTLVNSGATLTNNGTTDVLINGPTGIIFNPELAGTSLTCNLSSSANIDYLIDFKNSFTYFKVGVGGAHSYNSSLIFYNSDGQEVDRKQVSGPTTSKQWVVYTLYAPASQVRVLSDTPVSIDNITVSTVPIEG